MSPGKLTGSSIKRCFEGECGGEIAQVNGSGETCLGGEEVGETELEDIRSDSLNELENASTNMVDG